ncbi:hypothetical protein ACHWQZ_G000126 [Mnemiopsis leidyi]
MPSKGASLADGRERLLTNRKDYLAAVDSAADAGKTADSRESLSCIGTPCKSEPKPSQDANHSASKATASSLHFQHKDKIAPEISVRQKKKLKLPPASDKAKWESVQEDLIQICSEIVSKDPEEKLEKFEKTIHAYLEAGFGEENKEKTEIKERMCHEVNAVRISKKNVSRQFRQATADGDEKRISTLKLEYLRLVRLHNKSRRNEIRKKRKKEAAKEQAKFKKNPYQYGKKIFEGKKPGEPEFSVEEAEEFFKKEYSDKNRGMVYSDFSGIPPAEKPTKPFEYEALSLEEFEKKIEDKEKQIRPRTERSPLHSLQTVQEDQDDAVWNLRQSVEEWKGATTVDNRRSSVDRKEQ